MSYGDPTSAKATDIMAPAHTVRTADGRLGPHPSYIEVAKPFVFENKIQECLVTSGLAESRDDKIRLEGISWIDSVRKALHLYVISGHSPNIHAKNGKGLYERTIPQPCTSTSSA